MRLEGTYLGSPVPVTHRAVALTPHPRHKDPPVLTSLLTLPRHSPNCLQPVHQSQPVPDRACAFRPRAQPNFATTTLGRAGYLALRPKGLPPTLFALRTMPVTYTDREVTETREKGNGTNREFCGTPGNQGKVSYCIPKPRATHMLQLLRRSPSILVQCGWPGS